MYKQNAEYIKIIACTCLNRQVNTFKIPELIDGFYQTYFSNPLYYKDLLSIELQFTLINILIWYEKTSRFKRWSAPPIPDELADFLQISWYTHQSKLFANNPIKLLYYSIYNRDQFIDFALSLDINFTDNLIAKIYNYCILHCNFETANKIEEKFKKIHFIKEILYVQISANNLTGYEYIAEKYKNIVISNYDFRLSLAIASKAIDVFDYINTKPINDNNIEEMIYHNSTEIAKKYINISNLHNKLKFCLIYNHVDLLKYIINGHEDFNEVIREINNLFEDIHFIMYSYCVKQSTLLVLFEEKIISEESYNIFKKKITPDEKEIERYKNGSNGKSTTRIRMKERIEGNSPFNITLYKQLQDAKMKKVPMIKELNKMTTSYNSLHFRLFGIDRNRGIKIINFICKEIIERNLYKFQEKTIV
jgi:uncharacterized protein YlbG (UPF0298 family)